MERIIALVGFEDEFNLIKSKSDNLQVEIDNAKAEALAKIDLEFAQKADKIKDLLAQVSTIEVYEEEVVEEQETNEEPIETFQD